ncbi:MULTISPECIES: TonB-dependent receptor [unclassified Novosphingobium]|uniref:TonB-dependent receptor n=1 Tax=unclassified Novosphingobium TaxID=2644732 RepID=UPI0025ED2C81|nr:MULTISPECIES: TonB-dependent receptor [unclassified Novosphingobium]HQV02183.1 TonB-dependent receptor [Novosphingobium sp.]
MKRHLFTTTAAALVMSSAWVAPAMAQEAPAAEEDTGGIADIVVTASRRTEKMQDVAVTVQALGGEQLAERGITNFDQMLTELPQVHAGGRGPGQKTISIRGLSLSQVAIQTSAVAGASPTVALYLDDASVSVPGRNLDVYVTDLERVEVLEGPQGTLFGASAEGGAIRYITNKPNLSKFQAGFTLTGATTPGHAFSGAATGYINIPIIEDKLALRATVFVDRQGGYIDNIYGTFQMPLIGRNADGTVAFSLPVGSTRPVINNAAYARDDFNSATYTGGRVALRWSPADDWTITVQDMYQTLDAEGVFQYDPTLGDLKVMRFSPDTNHDEFNQVQWSVEGKLGGLDLVYTGSYLNRKVDQKFDYTRYAAVGPFAPYYICSYPGYASCATPRMTYLDKSRSNRFTQEFRIATPAENRFRMQAGVYYDDAKVFADGVWYYEGAAVQGFRGQRPGGSDIITDYIRPDGGVYFNDAERGESQFALFGEASVDITDKLTLTAGIRWYNQETSLRGSVNCGGLITKTGVLPNGNPCGSGNYAVSLAGFSPAHEKGTTPKVTLSYKPNDDMLFYATFSEGYRPGGFNRRGGATRDPTFFIPKTYQSDSVKNYEFGWKLQFANNTVRWNGSAFMIDWTGIPVSIYAPRISNSTFVLNGPNARIKGLTTDLVWRATPEFTITANLAWNDSELNDYANTPAGFRPQPGDGPLALTFVELGSPLALAPNWQGGMRMRYERTNASDTTFFAQLGGQFVGTSYTSTIKPQNFRLPGYAQFDASAGFKRENWNAELFVSNLTDKRAITYTSNSDNINLNSTIRPRTIGLRLGYNY